MSEVLVIGHRNPDTDAICSAIGYAEFKRRTGMDSAVAARCACKLVSVNDNVIFKAKGDLREEGLRKAETAFAFAAQRELVQVSGLISNHIEAARLECYVGPRRVACTTSLLIMRTHSDLNERSISHWPSQSGYGRDLFGDRLRRIQTAHRHGVRRRGAVR